MVKTINCRSHSDKPIVYLTLWISATNQGAALGRYLQLPLPPPVSSSAAPDGFFYTSVAANAEWLIGQGRFPFAEVVLSSSGSASLDCTLTGELIDPIQ